MYESTWSEECSSHSPFLVLHGPDGPQAQQEVVAGDQRQIHDLSGSSEKPVSRVAVRQWQLLSGQHDLVGERRFPQRCSGLRQPLCQIEGEANSAPGIEQQRLPGRDGRKPQFIGGVPQLGSDARIEPGRCLQGPKPDVGVEKKVHSRSASISVWSITGATMSPKICMLSFMEPIQAPPPASGEAGTTSATGLPKRVIRRGFLVCRTRSRRARHLALNSEMATSSMVILLTMTLYHGRN